MSSLHHFQFNYTLISLFLDACIIMFHNLNKYPCMYLSFPKFCLEAGAARGCKRECSNDDVNNKTSLKNLLIICDMSCQLWTNLSKLISRSLIHTDIGQCQYYQSCDHIWSNCTSGFCPKRMGHHDVKFWQHLL